MIEDSLRIETVAEIKLFLVEQFNLDIGLFEASELVEIVEKRLVVPAYNKALDDAKFLIDSKLSFVTEALYELERY